MLDLCEVLGLSLDEARMSHIAALDLTALDALKRHLKAHKSWPA